MTEGVMSEGAMSVSGDTTMSESGETAMIDQIRAGLSPEQQQALGIRSNGVISAGAGAGKSRTLVNLIARDILVDGIAPEDILVCTFTKAAANKLVVDLTACMEELAGSSDLGELWIGTIDGICSRIIRQYALQAGVAPRFRVADERMLWPLKRSALADVLTHLDRETLHLLGEVIDLDSEDFVQQLPEIVDTLRESGVDMQAIPVDIVAPLADPSQLIGRMQTLAEDADVNDTCRDKLRQDIQALGENNHLGFSSLKYGKGKASVRDEIASVREAVVEYQQGLIDQSTIPYRRALAVLISDFHQRYHQLKQDRELMDFLDMALGVQSLLSDKGDGGAMDGGTGDGGAMDGGAGDGGGGGDGDDGDTRDSGGEVDFPGFKRVYIDEAQDTNPLQLEILSALGSTEEDAFRVSVGDINQSIYGFRRADIEGFRQQKEAAQENSIVLSDNYRSQGEILEVINGVFSAIPEVAPDLIQMEAKTQKCIDYPVSVAPVELIQYIGESNPGCREEAERAVPHILKTAGDLDLAYSDICILCRGNADAAHYANALRRVGVPAMLIQKKGLMQQEEVQDLLAYLQLLDDPDHEGALIRVLSSPLVGVDDEVLYHLFTTRERVDGKPASLWPSVAASYPDFYAYFSMLFDMREAVSVNRLLEKILLCHDFDLALKVLDETDGMHRNVEKFVRVVADIEAEFEGPDLSAMVERFEQEREANIDEGQDTRLPDHLDAVKVMTIHNSKGDEFPLTVVARLSRSSPSASSVVWADRAGRIGLSVNGYDDSVVLQEKERKKLAEEAEERRLYYVAMTRAEKQLTLVASTYPLKQGYSWRGPAKWLIREGPLSFDPQPKQVELPFGRGSLRITPAGEPLPERPRGTSEHGEVTEIPKESSYGEMLPHPDALSYTRLSSWRKCGLRKHLEGDLKLGPSSIELMSAIDLTQKAQVLAVEEGKERVLTVGEGLTGASKFGTAVHKMLAGVDWSKPLAAQTQGVPAFFTDQDRAKLQGYFKLIEAHPVRERLRSAECLGVELAFAVMLGSHRLQGQIDFIGQDSEGILVTDWKTGEDDEDLFAADYALQRKLYAYAVLSQENPPDRVELIWLGAETEQEAYQQKDLEALRRDLLAAIEEIVTAEPIPATTEPMQFCYKCPGLEMVCPVSRAI